MGRCFERAWLVLLTTYLLGFGATLEEVQEKALRNFPQLKIEKLEERKRSQERLEKFGKLLPQINLEASYNISKKQSFSFSISPAPPQEITFQKERYPRFTLRLVQNIFDYTAYKEYEISKLSEVYQRFMTEERRNELIYKVREAYINTLKALSAVRVYKKQLERMEAHLRDVKLLYEEGIVAFKDVLETKVKLYEIKEKLSTAEANYRKALSYLSYLAGEEIKEVEEIDLGEKDILNKSYEELLSIMKERNPILKYMRGAVKISEKTLELSRSTFYPKVVLDLVYQRTEESDIFPKNRYFISFALRWNLFSGLRRLRALEISRLSHLITVESYREREERLKTELRSILEDIRSAEMKIEFAKKQLEDAKEHLRIAKEKYKAGLGTNTEVLDAQSYLTTAEEALAVNRYELILKIFKLQEVLGYEE